MTLSYFTIHETETQHPRNRHSSGKFEGRMLGGRGPEPDLEYEVSVSLAVALYQISGLLVCCNVVQEVC